MYKKDLSTSVDLCTVKVIIVIPQQYSDSVSLKGVNIFDTIKKTNSN